MVNNCLEGLDGLMMRPGRAWAWLGAWKDGIETLARLETNVTGTVKPVVASLSLFTPAMHVKNSKKLCHS